MCQSLVVYTSASAVSLVYWLSSDTNLLFVAISDLRYVLYLDGIGDTVVQVFSSTLSSSHNLSYLYICLVVLHNHT